MELLRQFGWFSVHQLAVYHTVVLVHKVLQAKSPTYLFEMFSTNYTQQTRQATNHKIRHTRTPRLELSRESFRWRGEHLYNQLPENIRRMSNIQNFKFATRQWVASSVEVCQ